MSKPNFRRGDILVTGQGLPFICIGKYEDERETIGALGGIISIDKWDGYRYSPVYTFTLSAEEQTAWTNWNTVRPATLSETLDLYDKMRNALYSKDTPTHASTTISILLNTYIKPAIENCDISKKRLKTINWEQRRYEIAKTVMWSAEGNPDIMAEYAVKCADALIKKLKGDE